MLRAFRGTRPSLDPSVWCAAGAEIIGNVSIGADSSVWFNAVIRGDINAVRIGERTNIQDGCILHVTGEFPLIIGSGVTLGHGAIVHGCTIHDGCLIGMGAVVLDQAVIESWSVVAAGAVVRPGQHVPPGVLVAGVPAKVVRDLTPEEREAIAGSARQYVGYAKSHHESEA